MTMNRKKSLQQMIIAGLILFFLAGCSSAVSMTPTPVPPSLTPLPTFTLTPTITPSPTSTSTSTPVPIPPIPTFQALDKYEDPMVDITDRQGVNTIVQVERIDTGDLVLDYGVNLTGT